MICRVPDAFLLPVFSPNQERHRGSSLRFGGFSGDASVDGGGGVGDDVLVVREMVMVRVTVVVVLVAGTGLTRGAAVVVTVVVVVVVTKCFIASL